MRSDQQDTEQVDALDKQDMPVSLTQSILRAALGLGIFAIITAGLIALTQQVTAERIEEEVKKARAAALYEIVPLSEHDNDLLNDAFWVKAKALGLADKTEAYVAKQNGQTKVLILPLVAPDGYTGAIRMILGLTPEGVIAGLRVVQHKETPGLGDKIELKKSDWSLSFNGRSLANTATEAWAVKKDGGAFDQLTGATITPRAIVASVYRALQLFDEHKQGLLNQSSGDFLDIDAFAKLSADASLGEK